MRPQVFTEQELSAATVALFASSTVDRYQRMAMGSASRTELAATIGRFPEAFLTLVPLAQDLARRVVCARERSRDEVELAMILALLASSGSPKLTPLLVQLSLNMAPAALWIAAFARRLLKERTSTQPLPRASSIVPTRFVRPRNISNIVDFKMVERSGPVSSTRARPAKQGGRVTVLSLWRPDQAA